MGTYTINQVLQNTFQHKKNRFDYRDRDVLKRITMRKVTTLNPDRPGRPSVRYEATTYSYPQYAPYYTGTDKRGRTIKYQRSVKHEYDITFTIDRLSLNTRNWKMVVGSVAKWRTSFPQSQLKVVSRKTRAQWKKKLARKYKGKELQEKYREKIERHKKKAPYLDIGDANSQIYGINADFIFTCSYVWNENGHHYGRNYYGWVPPVQKNPKKIMFFPKHALRFIEILMNKGILKNN